MHLKEILRAPYVLQLFFLDFWGMFSAKNSNAFVQENFVFTFENKLEIPSFIFFFEPEVHKYKLCDITAVSKKTVLV